MSLELKIIAALALLAAIGTGLWLYGEGRYNDGREDERLGWISKVLAKDQELAKVRRDHQDELTQLRSKQELARRKADADIARLIEQNRALKEWWETRIPADAIVYAWRLSRHPGNSDLPARPDAGAAPANSPAATSTH